MKTLILTLLLNFGIMPFAQGSEPVFSISDQTIHTNNKFLDPLGADSDYSYYSTSSLPVGSTIYTLKFATYTDICTDGDFDVIGFFKNNQEVLLFKERDGIIKFKNSQFNPPAYTFATSRYASLADNDHFIEVPLSATTKALIFVGMYYGTDLPKLMIFVLTPTDVKLVFYKQAKINVMEKKADLFSMEIQSTFPEPDVVPTTHTIWLENGLLMYKDN